MMKNNKIIVAAVILVLGLLIGSISYATVIASTGSLRYGSLENIAMQELSEYPVNENGQTYGSSGKVAEPDLVQAIGKSGKIGYVLFSELIGKLPNSPGEALVLQEKRSAEKYKKREIPVYESDGKTIIDYFDCDTPGTTGIK